MEEDMEGTEVMESEKLNLVMEDMEVAMEVVMEDMEVVMEVVMEAVMVMEVMVMEREMLNQVMEVMVEDLMEVMEVDMEVVDHMEDMVATMDKKENITFYNIYAPKIVNTSACKFVQLHFEINDIYRR